MDCANYRGIKLIAHTMKRTPSGYATERYCANCTGSNSYLGSVLNGGCTARGDWLRMVEVKGIKWNSLRSKVLEGVEREDLMNCVKPTMIYDCQRRANEC
ncbi:hypothetical protein ANCDUO_00386 [Ancylostoma duodenale]|uniref:Uncharacterized protein n=1 Tax=Ancylostoma duodenale TaxID=51022 RepID=A0A0C2HI00_9BILA|nr:hypothetical protein ANCDUO_00386 [Ancylostoma duodenale]